MNEATQSVSIAQHADFRFALGFAPAAPTVLTDEAPPLGSGRGPTPVQLLAASVGNCLAASLLFALRKFKLAAEPISGEVQATVGRNAQNRLRVQRLSVHLKLGTPAAQLANIDRVLAQFEAFCTVTESVRAGIPVDVEVRDSEGRVLAPATASA
jgi:organic hydroperoxide reductase OsmC/OhrA